MKGKCPVCERKVKAWELWGSSVVCKGCGADLKASRTGQTSGLRNVVIPILAAVLLIGLNKVFQQLAIDQGWSFSPWWVTGTVTVLVLVAVEFLFTPATVFFEKQDDEL